MSFIRAYEHASMYLERNMYQGLTFSVQSRRVRAEQVLNMRRRDGVVAAPSL